MSQHDFEIANQGFPSFRSDLNSALQALASLSAGTSAPSTTFAYQFWYDSTNQILKMRNGDDDAWISLVTFDQTNDHAATYHLDNWTITEDASGNLIFATGGTSSMKVDASGNLTVIGDVTAFGTI